MSASTTSGASDHATIQSGQPVILDNGTSICVYSLETGVSGEGATIDAAYSQYKTNLTAFEKRRSDYALPAVGPQPLAPMKNLAIWQELALFFTKTTVAAAAVVVVIILLLPNINAALRNQVTSLIPQQIKDPGFWMVQFPAKVNGRFDRMEPAEAEQMNKDWARLLDRAKPALQAIKCAP